MNILVPVDFSDVTDEEIRQAVRLGKALDGRLVLLHVASPMLEVTDYPMANIGPSGGNGMGYGPIPLPQTVKQNHQRLRERLSALEGDVRRHYSNVESELIEGIAGNTILAEARSRHAEMIVMGSHGHGAVYQLLVGSVTDCVLRRAPCPVLVVPAQRSRDYPD